MNLLNDNESARIRHAAAQQEAIENAVQALHAATADDQAFRTTFERLVRKGIESLQTDICLLAVPSGLNREWEALAAPLKAFTEDETERKYLLSKLLLMIVGDAFWKYELDYRSSSRMFVDAA